MKEGKGTHFAENHEDTTAGRQTPFGNNTCKLNKCLHKVGVINGTVSVILSYLTMVHLYCSLNLIKNVEKIPFFRPKKCLFLHCFLNDTNVKVTCRESTNDKKVQVNKKKCMSYSNLIRQSF